MPAKTLESHRRILEGIIRKGEIRKNWWPCGRVWWGDRKAGSDLHWVLVVSFPIPAPGISEHKARETVIE